MSLTLRTSCTGKEGLANRDRSIYWAVVRSSWLNSTQDVVSSYYCRVITIWTACLEIFSLWCCISVVCWLVSHLFIMPLCLRFKTGRLQCCETCNLLIIYYQIYYVKQLSQLVMLAVMQFLFFGLLLFTIYFILLNYLFNTR